MTPPKPILSYPYLGDPTKPHTPETRRTITLTLAEILWDQPPDLSRLVDITRGIVGSDMFDPTTEHSRFRNDDGSETAATWSDAEDTDPVVIDVANIIRIRFTVEQQNTASGSETFQLQYENSTKSTGFVNVTTTSAHLRSVASADTSWTISDGDATTDQITGAGSFVAGEMDEDGVTGSISFLGNDHTQIEFVVQVQAGDVDNDDNINLRLVNAMGQALNANVVPSITVEGVVGLTFIQEHFRIRPDDEAALNANAGGDWEELEDVNATIGVEIEYRIRFSIAASAGITEGFQLRAQKGGSGGYVQLFDDATPWTSDNNKAEIAAVPSDNFSDLAATTELLTASAGSFVAGDGNHDSVSGTAVFAAANDYTEMEWVILVRKTAQNLAGDDNVHNADGDFWDFRVYRDDGTALDTYDVTPRVTVGNRPGHIGGTVAETARRNMIVDEDGNLYYCGEYADRPPASGGSAEALMMKSTDGGVSFNVMDNANEPTDFQDLESIDMEYIAADDTIYIGAQLNNEPWFFTFRTAGHASPDTWDVAQVVDAGITADGQIATIHKRADNTIVMFYNEFTGGSNFIRYRIRTSGGVWGSQQDLDGEASTNITGVKTVMDGSDLIHIFYHAWDTTNGEVWYKSLTSSDVLLATRVQVDQGGPAIDEGGGTGRANIGGVVLWDDGGTERVGLVYQDDDTDDAWWNESPTSSIDFTNSTEVNVMTDTRRSGQSGTHLNVDIAVDQVLNEIWMFGIDLLDSTANLKYNQRIGGTWQGDTDWKTNIHKDPKILYFTHAAGNGGDRVIGVVYFDLRDNPWVPGGLAGVMRYDELVLATAGQTIAIGVASELGVAQVVAPVKPIVTAIGTPAESGVAQVVIPVKPIVTAIGTPAESEVSQALSIIKTAQIGTPSELEIALGVLPIKPIIKVIGTTSEVEVAQAVAAIKTVVLGTPAETEAAQVVAALKPIVKVIGIPSEAEVAQVVLPIKPILKVVGTPVEAEVAQALAAIKVVPIGTALEGLGYLDLDGANDNASAPDVNRFTADEAHLFQSKGTWLDNFQGKDTAQRVVGAAFSGFGLEWFTDTDSSQWFAQSTQANHPVLGSTEYTLSATYGGPLGDATDVFRFFIRQYDGGLSYLAGNDITGSTVTAGQRANLTGTTHVDARFWQINVRGDGGTVAGGAGAYVYDLMFQAGSSTTFLPSSRIVGTVDMRAYVQLPDYSDPEFQSFISKDDLSAQRSYYFDISPSGALRCNAPTTTATSGCSVTLGAAGVVDGDRLYAKTLIIPDTGGGTDEKKFFIAKSPLEPLVQIGITNSGAGATTIPIGSAQLEVGTKNGGASNPLTGKIFFIELRDGDDGPLVANPDWRHPLDQGWSSPPGTDDEGNVWTLGADAEWITGAQPVAALKPIIKVIGTPSEAEVAEAIAAIKSAQIGTPSETEVGQSVLPIKVAQIGTPAETEVAQVVTPVKPIIVTIGTPAESETAQIVLIIQSQNIEIGTPSETEAAQIVIPVKPIIVTIGTPAETEVAQLVNIVKTLQIGTPAETEAGQPVIPIKVVPIGTAIEGGNYGLDLPEQVGHNATTPDHADFDVVDTFEGQWFLSPPNWNPVNVDTLGGQWVESGDERSWSLRLTPTGKLQLAVSSDGIDSEFANMSGPSFAGMDDFFEHDVGRWVAYQFDGGTVRFYDGGVVRDAPVWIEMGTGQTLATITAVHNSTAVLEIGSQDDGATNPFDGTLLRFRLYDDLTKSSLLADFDGNDFALGESDTDTAVDSAGRTWTINGANSVIVGAGAQAVLAVKPIIKAIGVPSETESAVAVNVIQSQVIVLGTSAEIEAAQAIIALKPITKAIGTPAETEAAQVLNAIKTVVLGTPAETEAAQVVAPVKPIIVTIGTPAETEAAQVVAVVQAGGQTFAIGVASEVEISQVVVPSKPIVKVIGFALEAEAAQAVNLLKPILKTIGTPAETELAEGVGVIKPLVTEVGTAAEIETAESVNFIRVLQVGTATETEIPFSITVIKIIVKPIGEASETELAEVVGAGISGLGDVGELLTADDTGKAVAVLVVDTVAVLYGVRKIRS